MARCPMRRPSREKAEDAEEDDGRKAAADHDRVDDLKHLLVGS